MDRQTGQRTYHVLQAFTEEEAVALASRMGYVIGSVQIEHSPSPAMQAALPRPARRWLWFGFGTGFGIVSTLVVLFGVGALLAIQAGDRTTRFVAEKQGVMPSDVTTWAETWPTLDFPPRTSEAVPKTVKRDYDRFDDFTSLKTDLPPTNSDMKFWVLSVHRGDTLSPKEPPISVSMSVLVSDSSTTGDLTFIVDGLRIVPALNQAGWELASWHLSTKDLLQIASAKQVSVRLESHEYELPAAHQAALRDFASMLRP